jgi:hypothetical protein
MVADEGISWIDGIAVFSLGVDTSFSFAFWTAGLGPPGGNSCAEMIAGSTGTPGTVA